MEGALLRKPSHLWDIKQATLLLEIIQTKTWTSWSKWHHFTKQIQSSTRLSGLETHRLHSIYRHKESSRTILSQSRVSFTPQQDRPVLWVSLLDMLRWRDKLKVILREQRLRSGMCGMTKIRGWHGVIADILIPKSDTYNQHLFTTPVFFIYTIPICFCSVWPVLWNKQDECKIWGSFTSEASVQNRNNFKAVCCVQLLIEPQHSVWC